MKIVNNDTILELGKQAFTSERKRVNMNLHEVADDPLQRMINVLEPGTYLCPHMHKNPDKREIFVILRGSLLVCLFDDNGKVKSHVVLGRDEGNYIIEIPPATWHSIIPLAVHTAVFECKDGPYNPDDDKIFAPWAPAENSPGTLEFNKKLLKGLGLVFPDLF